MMSTIVIADRDHTERSGIHWYIQSNNIHFRNIVQAADMDEFITQVEAWRPGVVCLELEMIPSDRMPEVVRLMRQYVHTVICLTAEAVFERALQAIELHGFALLVKPVPPEQLKRRLLQALRRSRPQAEAVNRLGAREVSVSYASLFMEQADFMRETAFMEQTTKQTESMSEPPSIEGSKSVDHRRYSLLLLRPERTDSVTELYDWLQQYPLPFPAQLFVLPEQVACIAEVPVSNERTVLRQEAHRLLQCWLEDHPRHRLNLSVYPASAGKAEDASLHDMYTQATGLFKLRFYKGLQQLFWIDEPVSFRAIDPFLTPGEQREWIRLLDEGDKEGLKKWLYEAFTSYTPPYPEPDLVRVRLTSVLAQLRRFMRTYHLDQDPGYEQRYHRIFQTVIYEPVLFSIVQEIILFLFELIDGARRQKKLASTDVIERGLQYMEHHFREQSIRLQDVADHVGVSANYFSTLLTGRKRQSFRQLLTGMRLKEAQRLLRETNLTVQAIAGEIGYGDPNYFSRVFKAEIGQSPRVYRQHQTNRS